MQTTPASAAPTLTRRIAGQGAMLMSGFAASQFLSFGRNALLGHMLAKGDFGVAALLTLLLQLLDSLTDLGVDRLIIQAPDGDEPHFVAANHTALVIRGLFIGTVLLTSAGAIAGFFAVPAAEGAIAAIALVPILKGFQHLDCRRAQRRLDNRPFLWTEILPQATALLLTWPIITYAPNFYAVVWLSLIQAGMTLSVSHVVAERPYALNIDFSVLKRLFDFGWPIWLSAFPLIAVYHGDRIVIGRLIGIEELAGYSAAFMVAMVPGLIAAKVGQSLMLPLFSAARGDAARLARQFAAMTEATAIVAAVYLVTAMLMGGLILEVAFGPNFSGLGAVMAWLSAMWAVRMLQAVPGMILLSTGETKPFLIAGLIRSLALIPAIAVAAYGLGLEAVAAMGLLGEIASLAYISWRMNAHVKGLSASLARRAAFLIPAALAAGMALIATTPSPLLPRALALVLALGVVAAAAAALMPETRDRLHGLLRT